MPGVHTRGRAYIFRKAFVALHRGFSPFAPLAPGAGWLSDVGHPGPRGTFSSLPALHPPDAGTSSVPPVVLTTNVSGHRQARSGHFGPCRVGITELHTPFHG